MKCLIDKWRKYYERPSRAGKEKMSRIILPDEAELIENERRVASHREERVEPKAEFAKI